MRCPKCGTENSGGRVLCVRCGTRLRAGAGPVAVSPTSPEAGDALMRWLRRDLTRLVIVLVAVVAAAVTLGMVLR